MTRCFVAEHSALSGETESAISVMLLLQIIRHDVKDDVAYFFLVAQSHSKDLQTGSLPSASLEPGPVLDGSYPKVFGGFHRFPLLWGSTR